MQIMVDRENEQCYSNNGTCGNAIEGGEMMINTTELKAEIKRNGMTQVELSRKIGMDPSTLNKKINNKQSTLSVDEAQKIAEILHIPHEKLFIIFCTWTCGCANGYELRSCKEKCIRGGKSMNWKPKQRTDGRDEFMVQRAVQEVMKEMEQNGWTQAEAEMFPKCLEGTIRKTVNGLKNSNHSLYVTLLSSLLRKSTLQGKTPSRAQRR